MLNHIIQVRSLRKEFGSFCAVDNIDFSVAQGSIFAFLGPNGAGKTTTIKMLTTLLRPTAGSMLLNGFDPIKQPWAVRRCLGIVFQDPSLDEELTALENMQYHAALYGVARSQSREAIEKFLRMVELWDQRNKLVKFFSGGMKRRLEVARGLSHNPKILFLDEPTLGLDPQTRKFIWDYIKKINREENVTVFFTTHYMDEAERMADRIAIIDRGKLISSGTPLEIKSSTASLCLETAFIALTGQEVRQEKVTNRDQWRLRHLFGRRR